MLQIVLVIGVGLVNFIAIRFADRLVGHNNPIIPAIVSAAVMALWIMGLRSFAGNRRQS